MKTLFIECNMGAAGDMLMAALLELHPDPDTFIGKLNSLGIPGVRVSSEKSEKCGIAGTQLHVYINAVEEETVDIDHHFHREVEWHEHDHQHEHSHSDLAGIGEILANLDISDEIRADALSVYGLIAEAEGRAHGQKVETVHFHEVGMMDAVADIVGVCLLLEELSVDRIVVSPINLGSGHVKCAHGILPVPAPATANILKGVPVYAGAFEGELCTPTGAALLRHFADDFAKMPLMKVMAIGYGLGKKDFPAANCLRVFLGEENSRGNDNDIVEIACNLDDMTGEELAFALELLLENGALDAFIIPIQMKKGRPGQMLLCLCRPEDEERMVSLMLRHTSTFGLRSRSWRRHILDRSNMEIETEYGSVRRKSGFGYGVKKSKLEYEDLARIARENDLTLAELKEIIKHS